MKEKVNLLRIEMFANKFENRKFWKINYLVIYLMFDFL